MLLFALAGFRLLNSWGPRLLALTFSSPGEFVFRFPTDTPGVGGLGLRWYGLLMAAAVLIGLILTKVLAEARHLEKEPGKASERVERLALWLVVSGFLGARLYYVLTHWSEFRDNPLSAFAIWQGGIIIHGGLLAGSLALYFYCRATGINGWKYADVLTPGLILGQAIGRWGNFFNSEAYGAPLPPDSAWPLQVYIPPAAREPQYSQFEFFHPIFFYESVLDLVLFAVLMGMFWRAPKLKDGTWVWTYVIGYSLIRIPYEILRVSAVAYLPGTSIKIAYIASGLGLVIGIGMLVYMYRFRFDPDLEQLATWLSEQTGLQPEAAQTLLERAWAIQQKQSRADLLERVTLAMPHFPSTLAPSLSIGQRELIMRQLFCRLAGQKIPGEGLTQTQESQQ